MADRAYKINEPIVISYQAPNAESGLVGVVADIYLPGDVKDSSYPSVELVEIESTGNYVGNFTPDDYGVWRVLMHKADGSGQVPKGYSVGDYDVHSVGEAVAALDVKVSNITWIPAMGY
jgi:hypothetical protein